MIKLIFRSGIHTIGGTVVELINQKERIIFDFGTVFDPASTDEIDPRVSGVYDNTSEYNDHVLISHIHLDHVKAMNLVAPQIPIYMHSDSITMLEVLKLSGFDGLKGDFRPYTALDQTTEIGGFKVTPILVDHDVPGAVAYIFEHPDLTLVYTGDLRLHGMNPQNTYRLIETCQQLDVDVLISEGVTISFIEDDYKIIASNQVAETEIEFGKRLESSIDVNKITFFNPYIMGTERLQTFIELAKRLDKKIALSPASALIAKKYFDYSELYVLDQDVYNSGYPVIELDQIDANWFVQFEYNNKDHLWSKMTDQQLVQTGGEPLGDYDPRFNVLKTDLEQNNTSFIVEGLGGHASPENLQYICDEIAPKYTFPLHSFKPELLTAAGSTQVVPEVDVEYNFKNKQLVK